MILPMAEHQSVILLTPCLTMYVNILLASCGDAYVPILHKVRTKSAYGCPSYLETRVCRICLTRNGFIPLTWRLGSREYILLRSPDRTLVCSTSDIPDRV